MADHEYVFAFGSLVHRDGRPCTLAAHHRVWGVAMDNRLTIPGYKFYVDPATGERPAVYVAYLDIRADPDGQVSGVLFPATDLAALDRRERSYDRVEVTGLVDGGVDGRVWAYVGRDEPRERLAAGRRAGTAVVAREYLGHVRAGFESYGALAEFDATTEPLDLPVRELRRIDLA